MQIELVGYWVENENKEKYEQHVGHSISTEENWFFGERDDYFTQRASAERSSLASWKE